jgi:HlyD family secretion protein
MSAMDIKTLLPRRAVVLATVLLLSACQWQGEAGDGAIDLSGTVDARQVALAFQVGGRLKTLHADEGDKVQAGQTVAELDPSDYQLAEQRSEAEAESARMALAALEAGTRPQELRVAESTVAQAQSELQYADSEVKRVTVLVPKQLASQEQLDQAQLHYNVAWSTLEQARHKLALLREGPRQEDIKRARAELDARKAALDSARRQLGYTTLKSPVDGVISLRQAEAGQVVAPGQPVLQLTELSKPWVRAYLRESDLARVKVGQAAEVRVDGLPNKVFRGHLGYISPEAEFTPKTVETRELRVDLVYLIKVEVDNPEGLLKVGMPADVTFNAGS